MITLSNSEKLSMLRNLGGHAGVGNSTGRSGGIAIGGYQRQFKKSVVDIESGFDAGPANFWVAGGVSQSV